MGKLIDADKLKAEIMDPIDADDSMGKLIGAIICGLIDEQPECTPMYADVGDCTGCIHQHEWHDDCEHCSRIWPDKYEEASHDIQSSN